MDQRRITPVTTAGCFAAIMLILALLSTYVPFFSIVGYFIMPIPVAIIYMKFGAKWALMLALVVGILMGIFINPFMAILQLIAFGAVGIALGMGFKQAWSPTKMLMGVTLALAVTFIVSAVGAFALMDFDFWAFMSEQFETISNAILAGYENSGMSGAELAQAKESMNDILRLMPSIVPLLMVLGLSILSYVNIKIAQLILTRLGYQIRPFIPIRYWEIPRSMLYLYVLAMVCKYWGSTRAIDWLNIIGLNLEVLAQFAISVQGVAFVLYLLDRHFKLGAIGQACVAFVMLLIPIFQFFVFIAGLIDMVMGYRRKRQDAA